MARRIGKQNGNEISKTIEKYTHTAGAAIGIPGLHPHDLRHS